MYQVSIPPRYSKIQSSIFTYCLNSIVSIPPRYSKISKPLPYCLPYLLLFQSLLGILKSTEIIKAFEDRRLFQSLLGILKSGSDWGSAY